MKFLRDFAQRKAGRLEGERALIKEMGASYPVGSFGFEKGTLALAVWDLKIRIWRALAVEVGKVK